MSWREEYRGRCMTAQQAVKAICSGDRVWIQPSCGTPKPLIDALVVRAPELLDVELVHMKTLGEAAYTRPEYEGHFRHRGLFLGDNVREAVLRAARITRQFFSARLKGCLKAERCRWMWC